MLASCPSEKWPWSSMARSLKLKSHLYLVWLGRGDSSSDQEIERKTQTPCLVGSGRPHENFCMISGSSKTRIHLRDLPPASPLSGPLYSRPPRAQTAKKKIIAPRTRQQTMESACGRQGWWFSHGALSYGVWGLGYGPVLRLTCRDGWKAH